MASVEMTSVFDLWEAMDKREISMDEIVDSVKDIVYNSCEIRELIILWGIIRDAEKDGWRDGSHVLFFELYKYYPDIMILLLKLVPFYGNWKDYQSIYRLAKRENYIQLCKLIEDKWVDTIKRDYIDIKRFRNGEIHTINITNCAKYVPKEGHSLDKKYHVSDILASNAFYELYKRSPSLAKRKWRKLCSIINRNLETTETKMNKNDWMNIDFDLVPRGCLNKNIKVFMNEGSIDSLDRIVCRNNCIEFLRSNKKHDILDVEGIVHRIRKMDYKPNIDYELKMDGLYEMKILNMLDKDVNTNGFVVGDTSGSMIRGDRAIDASLSCILTSTGISVRNNGIFGSSYMTTGIKPILRDMVYPTIDEYKRSGGLIEDFDEKRVGSMYNLLESIKSAKFSSGGGSMVDIVKCYDMLLKMGIEKGGMVDWLLIVSDIELEHMKLYIGRNTYETLLEYDDYFKNISNFEETMSNIESVYMENGFKMPKLIYYNVDTNYKLSISDKNNIINIVGYDNNIMERIYSNNFTIETELEKFNNLLKSPRYNAIVDILDSFVYSE